MKNGSLIWHYRTFRSFCIINIFLFTFLFEFLLNVDVTLSTLYTTSEDGVGGGQVRVVASSAIQKNTRITLKNKIYFKNMYFCLRSTNIARPRPSSIRENSDYVPDHSEIIEYNQRMVIIMEIAFLSRHLLCLLSSSKNAIMTTYLLAKWMFMRRAHIINNTTFMNCCSNCHYFS